MSPTEAFVDLSDVVTQFSTGVVPAFHNLLQAVKASEEARLRLEDEIHDLKTRPVRLRDAIQEAASASRTPGTRRALRLFIQRRVPRNLIDLSSEAFAQLLTWTRDEAPSAFAAEHPDAYPMPDLRAYEHWLVQNVGLQKNSAREYRLRLLASARTLNTPVSRLAEVQDLSAVPPTYRSALKRFAQFRQSA